MDTQNDGLEQVTPFKPWPLLVAYDRFLACRLFTLTFQALKQNLFLQRVPNRGSR